MRFIPKITLGYIIFINLDLVYEEIEEYPNQYYSYLILILKSWRIENIKK